MNSKNPLDLWSPHASHLHHVFARRNVQDEPEPMPEAEPESGGFAEPHVETETIKISDIMNNMILI